jgi:hypothetical protein
MATRLRVRPIADLADGEHGDVQGVAQRHRATIQSRLTGRDCVWWRVVVLRGALTTDFLGMPQRRWDVMASVTGGVLFALRDASGQCGVDLETGTVNVQLPACATLEFRNGRGITEAADTLMESLDIPRPDREDGIWRLEETLVVEGDPLRVAGLPRRLELEGPQELDYRASIPTWFVLDGWGDDLVVVAP